MTWQTSLLLISLALGPGQLVQAAANHPPRQQKTVKPKVDVIQGARRNTKLFMDFDAHTPNIDAILFNRDDFNDFHSIDSKQRLYYQKVEAKPK